MCRCTPNIRTPFCGRPGCEWPAGEMPGSTRPRDRCLFAHTPPTPPEGSPEYISINERDGKVELTVRSCLKLGGHTAAIALDPCMARDLARAITMKLPPSA